MPEKATVMVCLARLLEVDVGLKTQRGDMKARKKPFAKAKGFDFFGVPKGI
ncbi:hypothetical protein [Paucidesulfovibrio gracilis]|uniref:hypothetical protein n=1 Tax=Paucidesulfovibrio gracilis TaxID=47158 RepID=UPI0013565254|nr:hypothetical protein [Paucidesulfovibrio gracilis]